MKLSEELQWRGFAHQTTFADGAIDEKRRTFYWGVDPSADSMTIGNLAAAMMAKVFIKHGWNAVLLVGGATGMIGDPDGKKKERELKSLEVIEKNKAAITAQYNQLFDGMQFDVVDNYDWFKSMGYLDFLRDVGKHVPLSQMLDRSFVRDRLGEDGEGISYAEFSYALIQGFDFVHLQREHGVTVQLCGADQWGNSVAGVDLIRRIDEKEAHVVSCPLIVNKATGKKFGKTEDGAIWLDEHKTTVYTFYQFWINVDDEGVHEYLNVYTELDKSAIDDIVEAHREAPSNRLAQKHLAYEVTKIVHGEVRATAVQKLSEVLFGGGAYDELTKEHFHELRSELPHVKVSVGDPLVDSMVDGTLASSRGEARRFLQANAVYINGSQIPLQKDSYDSGDFIDGFCVVRRGKNTTMVVESA